MIIRCLPERFPAIQAPVPSGVVRKLSDLSFGVYLVHAGLLSWAFPLTEPAGGTLSVAGVMAVRWSAAVAISLVVTALFRRLPGLNRVV